MIVCDLSIICNIATLITAISALLTSCCLWYDRRPRLILTIEPIKDNFYLSIENIGKTVARNIKIFISNEFIDSLPEPEERKGISAKTILKNIQKRKFYYTPGTKKMYYLIGCPTANEPKDGKQRRINNWWNTHRFSQIHIQVTYNGWYDIDEYFCMDEFDSEASVIRDSNTKITKTDSSSNTHKSNILDILHLILNEKTKNEKP